VAKIATIMSKKVMLIHLIITIATKIKAMAQIYTKLMKNKTRLNVKINKN
jgi:hypothetical protein